MNITIFFRLCILSIPFITSACASSFLAHSVPVQPIPKDSLTSQTLSIREEDYNSIMQYDYNTGIILIDFFDSNNNPAKIIRKNCVKAGLVLPESKSETIIFKNPRIRSYPAGSKARRQWRLKPYGEFIYAKDDRLKNLSDFSLTVPLMIRGRKYSLNYVFHE